MGDFQSEKTQPHDQASVLKEKMKEQGNLVVRCIEEMTTCLQELAAREQRPTHRDVQLAALFTARFGDAVESLRKDLGL
jgi:protoporphyrinogen oxidase